MASLSNINGLFDVHSTGAILFSTSHGTSGQILRSNGNAAPTWVAASTVIGGPYLPLAGGTLTGATATATGISFTVGGNLFVTGTSTFAGNVQANGGIKVVGPASHNSIQSANDYTLGFNDSGGTSQWWIKAYTNGGFALHENGVADKFTIAAGGNATFAGTLQSGNFAIGAAPSSFGSGVPTITLQGTAANSRGGAIVFKEQDGTVTTNIYSTDGSDGYGTVINAAQGSFKVNIGALASTKLEVTDYGSLVVGNTPGTNVNWGKIQCGGTITVGNSSGTYKTHGRISGDSDGMKLKGTSTGTYSNPQGVTINGYNVGINTNSPNVGNAYGLVIRSFSNPSRLVFWNNTSGEVSSRGQRISFENANCIFENMESGYYAFKTGGSSANPSERMRITSDGNVGIGTTSPGAKFQTVQTTSGEWTGGFKNYTANGYGLRIDMSNSSSVQSALQVYTGAGTGFVVKNNGLVGIGTFTPAQKLDVVGQVTHDGLVMKSGTGLYIDTVTTFNITLDFVAGNWIDTGLTSVSNNGLTLGESGTYIMQIYSDDHSPGEPYWYSMYWSGIMSWYNSSTNQANTQNPIVLQKAGHGDNNRSLEAQILWQTSSGTPANNGLLQLKCNSTAPGTNLRLKFRRLI